MKLTINNQERKIRVTDAYSAKSGTVNAYYAVEIFDKEMKCEVEFDTKPESAVVRPLSLGIKPEISGNRVIFTMNKPANISVEINDSIDDALIIFAEEKECMPTGNYKHIIKFEKGVHTPGHIRVTDDDTLIYLEDGALVNGKITAENVNNLTVCGNGIITMESYERNATSMLREVDIIGCRNVKISSVKIIDSCSWSLRIMGCDNVLVDGVKIIGHRGNSDGVDVCGSRNVRVTGVFTRVMDDSLVLKAFDTGDVENVLFENCTLWNDFARPIEIGVEIRAEKAHNIRYKNIDIIHSMVGYPCIGIHHGDRAEVYDIIVDDVRIEDAPGAQLFDLRITDSVWNSDTQKGKIHDITFKNIKLTGKPGIDILPSNSRLQGFSEQNNIYGIHFENISLMGKGVTTPEELGLLIQDYVKDVTVTSDSENKITAVKTTVSDGQTFTLNNKGLYEGSVIVTAENMTDKEISSHLRLQINPINKALYDSAFLDFTLKAHEKISKEYKVTLTPGKYVFTVQSDDVNIIPDWKYHEFDLILKNKTGFKYCINNYFNDKSDDFIITANDDFLTIESDALKKHHVTVYTAMPVDISEGQVMFSVPETDFGEAPAIINGKHGLELAPQLRCPAEVTYVFKNEPKVEKINKITIEKKHLGVVNLPWEYLGLPHGVKNFWFEIEIASHKKYPYTMFCSPDPSNIAHMFVNAKVEKE